ncbi:uncharacterized protein AB9W97_009375 isoform 2-T2 [Spinachia spinachia]
MSNSKTLLPFLVLAISSISRGQKGASVFPDTQAASSPSSHETSSTMAPQSQTSAQQADWPTTVSTTLEGRRDIFNRTKEAVLHSSPAPLTSVSTSSGATPSGATSSGATSSGGTWSDATSSGATSSGGTSSGGTWSGATPSGATSSGGTWSDATSSGATWSDATSSGATWSGATSPGATSSGYVVLGLIILVIIVLSVILYFLRRASQTYSFDLHSAPASRANQPAGTFERVRLHDLDQTPASVVTAGDLSPPAVSNGSTRQAQERRVPPDEPQTWPTGDLGDPGDPGPSLGGPVNVFLRAVGEAQQNDNDNHPAACSQDPFVEINLDEAALCHQLLTPPHAPPSAPPFSPFSFFPSSSSSSSTSLHIQ